MQESRKNIAVITRETGCAGHNKRGQPWRTTRICLEHSSGRKIVLEDTAGATFRLQRDLRLLEELAEKINSGQLDYDRALDAVRRQRAFVLLA